MPKLAEVSFLGGGVTRDPQLSTAGGGSAGERCWASGDQAFRKFRQSERFPWVDDDDVGCGKGSRVAPR